MMRQRVGRRDVARREDSSKERLAPADPPNDGKQTPIRNHPIFVAQHGTEPAAVAAWRNGTRSPKGMP